MLPTQKYSIEILPQLVAGVDEQVKQGTYDLDANLALLRFYQFQPSAIDVKVLAKVLLLSIMQLPSSDFKVCLHLVPERLHQNDETISKVVSLATALETTRFSDFWAMTAGDCKDVASMVPGFADAVRKYVLHVIGITFQRTSKAVLADALNLDSKAMDALIQERTKSHGWNVEKDLITLPRNELNSPVVIKRTQGPVRFEQVAPVLRCVTVGF
mmetsp:Transcript_27025/g.73049  ORF Transcript_27025/g.73049 Transcript_27025/m.73049 type:complete len:214 (-) Transcript_27025:468-1109(-)|eukprot:CAMPEP_0202347054 /NCGR_PEP_ID=MMETSP1126-20121109/5581_1 /ASSEMBLY_ACC=CAM_ASM_000457 /TAXON_ID=3047 /ORGANISM="Dunaliella tertiolecta, Strain CCMP1320" /LENGTH=213 /DNA_ID=CAMNT_0048938551 /DNA_START=61 /DNA_END=702 /DNA_ORIENTATION=-